MKKNIAIVWFAGLVVVFLYLWQAAEMRENSHKKKVANLAEAFAVQMKRGQEKFEWSEFVKRMGVETLIKKYFEVTDNEKHEEIELEIQKRLLGYGGNPTEPRQILIKKLFKDSFGKDRLNSFVKEAKETIRIYEEEGGKKWQQGRK